MFLSVRVMSCYSREPLHIVGRFGLAPTNDGHFCLSTPPATWRGHASIQVGLSKFWNCSLQNNANFSTRRAVSTAMASASDEANQKAGKFKTVFLALHSAATSGCYLERHSRCRRGDSCIILFPILGKVC